MGNGQGAKISLKKLKKDVDIENKKCQNIKQFH